MDAFVVKNYYHTVWFDLCELTEIGVVWLVQQNSMTPIGDKPSFWPRDAAALLTHT